MLEACFYCFTQRKFLLPIFIFSCSLILLLFFSKKCIAHITALLLYSRRSYVSGSKPLGGKYCLCLLVVVFLCLPIHYNKHTNILHGKTIYTANIRNFSHICFLFNFGKEYLRNLVETGKNEATMKINSI